MKQPLIQKLGASLGILAFLGICAAFVVAPSSCSLNPEQRQQLQAISVPAAGILSKAAVSQGWVEPGDEITIQRGVAVVVSDDKTEVKVMKLAELGLDTAISKGVLTTGDTVKVDTPTQVTITPPDHGLAPAATQSLPTIAPGELLPPPLPGD